MHTYTKALLPGNKATNVSHIALAAASTTNKCVTLIYYHHLIVLYQTVSLNINIMEFN